MGAWAMTEELVLSANHHWSAWEPGGMKRSGSNSKLHSSFLYRTGSLLLNCMKASPEAICFPCFPFHSVSGFCACAPDCFGRRGIMSVYKWTVFLSHFYFLACMLQHPVQLPNLCTAIKSTCSWLQRSPVCLSILQLSQDCNGGSSPSV